MAATYPDLFAAGIAYAGELTALTANAHIMRLKHVYRCPRRVLQERR
jgi:hypothetical protein